MILDKLEHSDYYQRSVPEIWEAVKFAKRAQSEQLKPGKYPVGNAFAFVQEGMTHTFEEGKFETHNKYLDVQILLEGSEMWEFADKEDLHTVVPYDPASDIEFLEGKGTKIAMKPGMFYVVYPSDGHKPCCHETEPTAYRKVVVKVKIDRLLHRVDVGEGKGRPYKSNW